MDAGEPGMAARRLLAVFPHPDDEAYGCAGSLYRAAQDPVATACLLTLTDGEASTVMARGGRTPAEIGQLRRNRMHAVAERLGLDELTVGGLPDGRLARLDLDRVAAPIIAALEKWQPHVVIAHDPRGVNGHADHIATHFAVRLALRTCPGARLAMVAYPHELTESMKPRLMFPTRAELIDACVTLSPGEVAAKEACLRIHEALVTLTDDGPADALRRPPLEYYDFLGESCVPRVADLFEGLPAAT